MGTKAAKGFESVPLVENVTTEPEAYQLLRVMSTGAPMGRSVAAPPGIPANRSQFIRDAFTKGIHDSDMLALAKSLKLPVNYTSGEDLGRMAKKIMATPKPIVDKLNKILNIKG